MALALAEHSGPRKTKKTKIMWAAKADTEDKEDEGSMLACTLLYRRGRVVVDAPIFFRSEVAANR
eukprot:5749648-Pyramimonas_sp.AAC.2